MTRRLATLLLAAALGISAPFASSAAEASSPARAAAAEAKVLIPVEGLTCASCSLTLRRALKRIDGVRAIEPGPQKNEAAVTYDASKVKPEQLVKAIDDLGFKAGAPRKG